MGIHIGVGGGRCGIETDSGYNMSKPIRSDIYPLKNPENFKNMYDNYNHVFKDSILEREDGKYQLTLLRKLNGNNMRLKKIEKKLFPKTIEVNLNEAFIDLIQKRFIIQKRGG